MSTLSRILNNDPAPGPSRYPPQPSPRDEQPQSPQSYVWEDARSQRSQRSPDPATLAQRSGQHTWASDDATWRYSSYNNIQPPSSHVRQHEPLRESEGTPDFHQYEQSGDALHLAQDRSRRKRKAVHDDNPAYQPSTSKRKGKSRKRNERLPLMDEEERRLASSDLEDCREIWTEELSMYVRDTRTRQENVAQYFWDNLATQNTKTVAELTHHYRTRISAIPLRAVSPRYDAGPSRDYASWGHPLAAEPGFNATRPYRRETSFGYDAENVADDLERSVLGDDAMPVSTPAPQAELPITKRKGAKSKESKKRVMDNDRMSGSEVDPRESSSMAPPPAKKRRTNNVKAKDAQVVTTTDVASDSVANITATPTPIPVRRGNKGKGKAIQLQAEGLLTREPSQDSVSAPVKGRKRPGPKKKTGLAPEVESEVAAASAISAANLHELGSISAAASYPPSISGDATPLASRASSPAPTHHSVLYDLDEPTPLLKKAKKVDDQTMMKRVKTLEEAQKKVWTNIARKDVAKVYKYHTLGYQTRLSQLERTAKLASIQARKPYTKTPKSNKDVQAKAKRLMREMQVFWKKNEKEERDVRRREQKEAMDRLKIEEEKREAARQARKLEFLISQTELYSHFVGNKLKTAEIEGGEQGQQAPAGAHLEDVERAALPEIDFDNEDHTNIHLHARANAQQALALAKERAQQFDTQTALERKTNEALKLSKAQAHIRDDGDDMGEPSGKAPLVDLDSDELNFQNPTSLSGPLTIGQPKMLMATLKEYQVKGLNWLATLYEQGINGILADEMGLGKTVQSISLLAYLAETHDIWGPFLVVAPASTLHNWQQELTRFVPHLRALPYWGNPKDRATLRKVWSKKDLTYTQDAPFHVLITSYQLVTQDQQYFQRVKWQYMILDEAQNIKNSSSVRWKTLLGFQCRNRLLLTGTPIQNSMQELWALLHFIMPSLFDSHDEFHEWFSKDIENASDNKGGSKLSEHQLRRLHMILKPFMLRRVKRHVQNELSEKIEIDVYVDMSARQRALYAALLAKVSLQDLLEKAANMGDADSARSLMNLVMQFRKVCNHPELFERADVVAPYSFSRFGRPLSANREGDFVILPYSSKNPILYEVPQLVCNEGGLVSDPGSMKALPQHSNAVNKLLNIWSTEWISRTMREHTSSSFAFLRFIDMSPQEAHQLHVAPMLRRELLRVEKDIQIFESAAYHDPDFALSMTQNPYEILTRPSLTGLVAADGLPHLSEISTTSWQRSNLSKPDMKWYIPAVVAPPIALTCTDRIFNERGSHIKDAPMEALALYGIPAHLRDLPAACATYTRAFPGLPPTGLITTSPPDQFPVAPMHVPEAKRLIYDSAKLARLDSLLQELKAGDHRVLVYFQMTRMMDLMEEYLIYRQYKYVRLDGSTKLEDRRDTVIDWQTRPDIFVFLLSTRAGGLGINLTAADTVIFYDHDWNPSNDAQAMDRAHRLGQTRQVTVYRLITKGTIDERIIQLARVKKDVQDIVVGNKTLGEVTKPSELVSLLLNDEQLASLDRSGLNNGNAPKAVAGRKDDGMGDLWNEEGDDFFGAGGGTGAGDDDGNGTAPVKKRRSKATGAPRGRRPGTGGGRKKAAAAEASATPSEFADM